MIGLLPLSWAFATQEVTKTFQELSYSEQSALRSEIERTKAGALFRWAVIFMDTLRASGKAIPAQIQSIRDELEPLAQKLDHQHDDMYRAVFAPTGDGMDDILDQMDEMDALVWPFKKALHDWYDTLTREEQNQFDETIFMYQVDTVQKKFPMLSSDEIALKIFDSPSNAMIGGMGGDGLFVYIMFYNTKIYIDILPKLADAIQSENGVLADELRKLWGEYRYHPIFGENFQIFLSCIDPYSYESESSYEQACGDLMKNGSEESIHKKIEPLFQRLTDTQKIKVLELMVAEIDHEFAQDIPGISPLSAKMLRTLYRGKFVSDMEKAKRDMQKNEEDITKIDAQIEQTTPTKDTKSSNTLSGSQETEFSWALTYAYIGAFYTGAAEYIDTLKKTGEKIPTDIEKIRPRLQEFADIMTQEHKDVLNVNNMTNTEKLELLDRMEKNEALVLPAFETLLDWYDGFSKNDQNIFDAIVDAHTLATLQKQFPQLSKQYLEERIRTYKDKKSDANTPSEKISETPKDTNQTDFQETVEELYYEARIYGAIDFVKYLVQSKHPRAGEFQKLSADIRQYLDDIIALDPATQKLIDADLSTMTTNEKLDLIDDIDEILYEMDTLYEKIDAKSEDIFQKAKKLSQKHYEYAYMFVLQHHVKSIQKAFPNISKKEMVEAMLPHYSHLMKQSGVIPKNATTSKKSKTKPQNIAPEKKQRIVQDTEKGTENHNETIKIHTSYSLSVGKEISFYTTGVYGRNQKYEWDFGDGHTSTEDFAKHTYEKSGKYTVKVVLILEDGKRQSNTLEIQVAEADDPYGWNIPDESGLSFNQRLALASLSESIEVQIETIDILLSDTQNPLTNQQKQDFLRMKDVLIQLQPFAEEYEILKKQDTLEAEVQMEALQKKVEPLVEPMEDFYDSLPVSVIARWNQLKSEKALPKALEKFPEIDPDLVREYFLKEKKEEEEKNTKESSEVEIALQKFYSQKYAEPLDTFALSSDLIATESAVLDLFAKKLENTDDTYLYEEVVRISQDLGEASKNLSSIVEDIENSFASGAAELTYGQTTNIRSAIWKVELSTIGLKSLNLFMIDYNTWYMQTMEDEFVRRVQERFPYESDLGKVARTYIQSIYKNQ